MEDLERLRFVTERYAQLQGLRLIPLSIPFALSSAWRDGQLAWVPWTHGTGVRVWFLALVGIAVGLSHTAGIYYRRRFGDVQAAASIKAFLAAALFTALFIAAASLQDGLQTSVSAPIVVMALGIGYVGLVAGRIRLHYVTVAGCAALFAVLGPLGVPGHTRDVLFDLLIAGGLIVIGIGDHVLLRRTLAPMSHADAV